MSGPVEETGGPSPEIGLSTIEVKPGRQTSIGRMGILRVLPTKQRRTIGPWCFVDLMSPDDIDQPPPLEIGPHPHIGLSTVTWLFSGSALHTDSLGTEQPIRPGEINLMTAGHGIAHAEQGTETSSAAATGGIMGVQMWLAQPEATRDGASGFQHHKDLPVVDLGAAQARLLIGTLDGESSPAAFDHPALGADLSILAATSIEIDRSFEFAVVPIDRSVKVGDVIVNPGDLALVPTGHERLELETQSGPGRMMLLGGRPLGEDIKMWWNFVARTNEEITRAWQAWQSHDDDRFGPVPSGLARMEAPRPPWLPAGD
jgi:redox-sensitive bicupin YhaK (pirin superfamily)